MKKFRKFGLLAVVCVLLLSLTGCKYNKEESLPETLPQVMDKVYSDFKEDELPMGLTRIDVNEENIESFLGTKDIEYKEVLASESMVTSLAHSVVLVRVKEGADVEKAKTAIKENIDPRKWICVWVEEDDVIIKNKGNLIIAIVVEDAAVREKISQNFDNL